MSLLTEGKEKMTIQKCLGCWIQRQHLIIIKALVTIKPFCIQIVNVVNADGTLYSVNHINYN